MLRRHPRSWIALAAALVCAGVLVAALPAHAPAKTMGVAARPALFPKFKRSVHDYVSRCGVKHPLRLSVRPASGESVSVGWHGRRSHGRFRATRKRAEGEETVLVSHRGKRADAYHVRCLPPKFPHWTARHYAPTQTAFYVITPSPYELVTIFDANGVPIWWMRTSTVPFDAKLLANHHIVWSRHHTGERFGVLRKGGGYEEHTLTGRLVQVRRTVGSPTDHHDMQPLPNGDWLMISYRRRDNADLSRYGGPRKATVLDAIIQEITPHGRVKWQWSSRHHISPAEQGPELVRPIRMPDGTRAYDLCHLNSVQFHGGRLLVSVHAANAVYDIDRRTKKIVWKLGGTNRPERLRTIGDPNEGWQLFGHQHNARVLPDGTVTVHDNATGLTRPPRAVRYRIDEQAHTATLLEDIPDPHPPKVSAFGGSATRLPGGHWVVSWGGTRFIDEFTTLGKPVFDLTFKHDIFSYKVDPIAPGALSRTQLRRAMNKMPLRLRGRFG